MSTPRPAPPAREANPAVLDALEMIIGEATKIVSAEIDPAIKDVEVSQQGLESQLCQLDAEMTGITNILEKVTLDPETSARMEETREVLRRTKRKLTSIRGRLGRLRTYEESDRLHLAEHRLVEKSNVGRGTEPARLGTDDLWDRAEDQSAEELNKPMEIDTTEGDPQS